MPGPHAYVLGFLGFASSLDSKINRCICRRFLASTWMLAGDDVRCSLNSCVNCTRQMIAIVHSRQHDACSRFDTACQSVLVPTQKAPTSSDAMAARPLSMHI